MDCLKSLKDPMTLKWEFMFCLRGDRYMPEFIFADRHWKLVWDSKHVRNSKRAVHLHFIISLTVIPALPQDILVKFSYYVRGEPAYYSKISTSFQSQAGRIEYRNLDAKLDKILHQLEKWEIRIEVQLIPCKSKPDLLEEIDVKMTNTFLCCLNTIFEPDLTVVLNNGMDVPVHRQFLAQVSPVLKTILENETALKAANNRIAIRDFEPEVVIEMILFAYTLNAPKIHINFVRFMNELHAMAHAFGIEDLKPMCRVGLEDEEIVEPADTCVQTKCNVNQENGAKNELLIYVTSKIEECCSVFPSACSIKK